jgi:hypothetical protein
LKPIERSKAVYIEDGFARLFSVQTARKRMNTGFLDSNAGDRLYEENSF